MRCLTANTLQHFIYYHPLIYYRVLSISIYSHGVYLSILLVLSAPRVIRNQRIVYIHDGVVFTTNNSGCSCCYIITFTILVQPNNLGYASIVRYTLYINILQYIILQTSKFTGDRIYRATKRLPLGRNVQKIQLLVGSENGSKLTRIASRAY